MRSSRASKDALYEQFARIGKAIAAPKRLELLDLLCQGPRTVEALAGQARVSVANASQHLRVLRQHGLVHSEKQGLYVEYRLASEQVAEFFAAVRALAEARLLEVEQAARAYLGDGDGLEAIEADELLRRARRAQVTVLDVRPSAEYCAGHLPGALSIPVDQLETRLSELPRGREVVAYCRGPYCVMAVEAVELLRAGGFAARRLEAGVIEFRARGIELERGGHGVSGDPA
ncbi:MAG: metalloregulator ArsR/SmtB family transcription factor [Myxococcales bacterium]|nr:metalloregulator ArsR/SmtB family transcription factor [Myxococcales bacterium]